MSRPPLDSLSRRAFLERAAAALPALAITPTAPPAGAISMKGRRKEEQLFKISLAQWSLHRAIKAGDLDPLDFAAATRNDYGLDAVEYVNSFFKDKARDEAYLADLARRAEDHGVRSLLIMVDGEGALGDPDAAARATAIENHHRWVDAAKRLGCHSIRVNAASRGTPDEQRRLAADGLARLTEYAARGRLDVLVENHGGLSSNGAWLASVMETVGHERCGTLPDFGNFRIGDDAWYDRYRGVRELMPFARAVSAKSHEFDPEGDETGTDYRKMLRIVLEAGYRGYVGIEYEGDGLAEPEGIRATKRLLEKVRTELTPAFSSAGSP